MADPPATGYISDDARDEAELKAALEDVRDCVEQGYGARTPEEVTIDASAVVTTELVSWVHVIMGVGVGNDTVDTLTADLPDGHFLLLENPITEVNTIYLEQQAATEDGLNMRGGLANGSTIALAPGEWFLFSKNDGAAWTEVYRSTAANNHRHVIYEVPEGGQEPDGSRTEFDVANVYHEGSLELYYNGVQQRPTIDYTEDGPGQTVTTTFTPESGSWIYWKYRY